MDFLEQLKEICDAYDTENNSPFNDCNDSGDSVYNFAAKYMADKGLAPQPEPVADWRVSGIVKPVDEVIADAKDIFAEERDREKQNNRKDTPL